MRGLIKTLTLILFLVAGGQVHAQVYEGKQLVPDSTDFPNVYVKALHSDTFSSTYAIWVKNGVKPHKHVLHTEVITVLGGKGSMTLGSEVKVIKKGDVVVIPQGTVHAVTTTSKKPLVVISVQSPKFRGKDRIWIKEKK
ncbi:MAG: cupin domain-containing protein [Bacteroidia bacterium]|nr:cupin domain-containing protein [Bacteroidia bacterium]